MRLRFRDDDHDEDDDDDDEDDVDVSKKEGNPGPQKRSFLRSFLRSQGIEERADEEIEAYQLRAQHMEAQMEKDAQAQASFCSPP